MMKVNKGTRRATNRQCAAGKRNWNLATIGGSGPALQAIEEETSAIINMMGRTEPYKNDADWIKLRSELKDILSHTDHVLQAIQKIKKQYSEIPMELIHKVNE